MAVVNKSRAVEPLLLELVLVSLVLLLEVPSRFCSSLSRSVVDELLLELSLDALSPGGGPGGGPPGGGPGGGPPAPFAC